MGREVDIPKRSRDSSGSGSASGGLGGLAWLLLAVPAATAAGVVAFLAHGHGLF